MSVPTQTTTQLGPLLARLQQGDTQARARLLEHTCERLRLLARRMLRRFPQVGRWEETDDVLVEAAARLYRSLEVVHPQSPRHFYHLASLQIRRVLIDFARHYYGPEGAGAHHATTGPAAGPPDGPPDGPPNDPLERCGAPDGEPADLLEWSEFHQQVAALPDPEREVFELLWYQGLTQAEAAAVLAVSDRTVRTRWQEARLRLHRLRQGERPPG